MQNKPRIQYNGTYSIRNALIVLRTIMLPFQNEKVSWIAIQDICEVVTAILVSPSKHAGQVERYLVASPK